MYAWRKHLGSVEPVREKVPIPSAPSNGFLVKVLAAGLCHTETILLHNETKWAKHWADKYTLGHEGCGIIEEIGSEVTDSEFKKGSLVAINSSAGCGSEDCLECGSGNPQLCRNDIMPGLGSDGSFAPYVAIPYRTAILVPEGVTPAQAAMTTDAGMNAYNSVKRTANIQPNETVLMFGLGGVGFTALQVVLHVGARVLVVDKRTDVLEDAERAGVPKVDIIPPGTDVVAFIEEKKIVVDVVLDYVGLKETFNASQRIVRGGGRIVQIGLFDDELTLSNVAAAVKKLSILYQFGGLREDIVAFMDLIADGTLKPRLETADLDDFFEWFKKLNDGKVKGRAVFVQKHD